MKSATHKLQNTYHTFSQSAPHSPNTFYCVVSENASRILLYSHLHENRLVDLGILFSYTNRLWLDS